jgi:hypothetical protein
MIDLIDPIVRIYTWSAGKVVTCMIYIRKFIWKLEFATG